jgi:hypothetical protein
MNVDLRPSTSRMINIDKAITGSELSAVGYRFRLSRGLFMRMTIAKAYRTTMTAGMTTYRCPGHRYQVARTAPVLATAWAIPIQCRITHEMGTHVIPVRTPTVSGNEVLSTRKNGIAIE